ncbi:MAG: amidase, partial [Phyllobacterium sp.]
MNELSKLGAARLSRLVNKGSVSSREIVTAFLNRIDALNPLHNAIVSLRDREDILQDADMADRAFASGDAT